MADAWDEARALSESVAELLRWEEEIGGFLGPASAGGADLASRSRVEAAASAPREPGMGRPSTGPSTGELGTGERTPSAEVESLDPTPSQVAPLADPRALLAKLAEQVSSCERCGLAAGRTQTVFARGSEAARLVFVGEGPGYHEDQQGLPFVGASGELLDNMITAMGYEPESVYICNVIKCRPPENRTPTPEESATCLPFLERQLAVVRPEVIVALGRCAAETLDVMPESGRGWRGRWSRWKGIDVMPTYHPSFLLRTPRFKRDVWNDLQAVMRRLQSD